MNFNLRQYPWAVLVVFLILVIYSTSTPFPKQLGAVELVIAFLLMISYSRYFLELLSCKVLSKTALFFILFYFPLIGTFYNQNEGKDIIRDIIPMFYLVIPLFLSLEVNSTLRKYYRNDLAYVAAFTGIVFSLRELSDWSSIGQLTIGVMRQTEEYIIQSPLVLFAGVFFLLQSVRNFRINRTLCISYFFVGLLPLLGFYFVVLRAPLILSLLIPCLYALVIYRRNVFLLLGICIVLVFLLLENHMEIGRVFQFFVMKNEIYGTNNKVEELFYVWDLIIINGDPITSFVGKGFGGTWLSPAVGVQVRYTHSLLTYSILKAGIVGGIGFCLFLLYLLAIGMRCFVKLRKEPKYLALFMSTWPTLFVNIFLESGYKTLGFGIVLAIFFSCCRYSEVLGEQSKIR